MATAAPFVKLLRQLSNAKDEYRSGALDITWDGGKASIYLVFGQPNHATFDSDDGETLEGQEALTALVHRLPRRFKVEPWRKTVLRVETLHCTLDELVEPFAQLAGANSPEDSAASTSAAVGALDVGTGFVVDFEFGLDDFPLLPLGESMWSEASANVVHLDVLIPKLPTSLVVLTGPKLRAAAVISRGQIIDAVWVEEGERAAGEGAAMALMGAREGTISGYRLDDQRIAEALTMLWRCPPAYRDVSATWLDPDRFLASLQREKRDCVLRVDGAVRAVAFLQGGEFVACYTDDERQPNNDPERLLGILRRGLGTISILQRAGDRPIGRLLSEDTYHAYVAQTAATPPPRAATEDRPPVLDVTPSPAALEVSPSPPALATGPTPEVSERQDAVVAPPEAATAEPTLDAPGRDAPAWPASEAIADVSDTAPEPVNDEPVVTPAPEVPSPGDIWADSHGADAEGMEDSGAHLDEDLWGRVAGAPSPGEEPEPPSVWTNATQWSASESADDWNLPAPGPTAHGDESASAHADAGGTDGAPDFASWYSNGSASEPDAHADAAGSAQTPQPAASAMLFDPETMGTVPVADVPPVLDSDELDYESIKADLIQIGVLWLGSDDVTPIADLIRDTKPSVDAFVATIEQIKNYSVPRHDPSVIRAMAREMQYHAAEVLCGA